MTLPPEHVKAKAYLLEKGTQTPVAQIRERVADAFAALESLLDGVTESQAHRAPGGGEWSVHEILDHLVATHPLALEEMRALLESRHSPVSPIPAGLQSADPAARRWDDLRGELRRLHADVLDVLGKAPDRMTDVRAPIIMVINTRQADGRREGDGVGRGVRLEGLRHHLPAPRARSSGPGETGAPRPRGPPRRHRLTRRVNFTI